MTHKMSWNWKTRQVLQRFAPNSFHALRSKNNRDIERDPSLALGYFVHRLHCHPPREEQSGLPSCIQCVTDARLVSPHGHQVLQLPTDGPNQAKSSHSTSGLSKLVGAISQKGTEPARLVSSSIKRTFSRHGVIY